MTGLKPIRTWILRSIYLRVKKKLFVDLSTHFLKLSLKKILIYARCFFFMFAAPIPRELPRKRHDKQDSKISLCNFIQ